MTYKLILRRDRLQDQPRSLRLHELAPLAPMRRVGSREVHYPVDAGRLGVADVIRVVHMLLAIS